MASGVETWDKKTIYAGLFLGSFPIAFYPWISKAEIVNQCKRAGAKAEEHAVGLLSRSNVRLVTEKMVRKHVIVSAKDIGLTGSNRRSTIYRWAHSVGLRECHVQAGWELLLPDGGRPSFSDVLIGTSPIDEVDENDQVKPHSLSLLFEIRNGKTMSVDSGREEIVFRADRQWLFEVVDGFLDKNQ